MPGLENSGRTTSGLRFCAAALPEACDGASSSRRQSEGFSSSSAGSAFLSASPRASGCDGSSDPGGKRAAGWESSVGECGSSGGKWKREEAVGTGGAL